MSYLFTHQGRAYSPDGNLPTFLNENDVRAHNIEQEQKEIKWLKTGPDKVFLYVRERTDNLPKGNAWPLSGAAIVTFLGTVVSQGPVIMGSRTYTGFGHHTYRHSITCRIFGTLYHGWYMASSGNYCRLKKAKVQR